MKRGTATKASVHEAIRNLTRLSELFQRRREQLAREAGLTVQQWSFLEQIGGDHFMPSIFARERESSRAAVSKTLRQLLDKGLVTVSISAEDGRQREYALTDKGRKVMSQVDSSRRDAIDAVWHAMDEDRLNRFTDISAELIERLDQYARAKE